MRKQKQLLDVRYALPMQDGNGSNLDLVEFDVCADKSSTESENEGFPLTQLPAASVFYKSQIVILSSNDLSGLFFFLNVFFICLPN